MNQETKQSKIQKKIYFIGYPKVQHTKIFSSIYFDNVLNVQIMLKILKNIVIKMNSKWKIKIISTNFDIYEK